jgi:hypothetical protein
MFIISTVGRVGRGISFAKVLQDSEPVSRPTVNLKTESCLGHGGFDTSRKAMRDYSTTSAYMKPRKI